MSTCGDAGGLNAAGNPCGRKTANAGDRCPNHRDGGTCGDAGGVSCETGEPCSRLTKGGRRCKAHNAAAEAELAEMKADFLKIWGSGEVSMGQAAIMAGSAPVTVWKWRQRDAEFDRAYTACEDQKDEIRLSRMEDANFNRIISGKAPSALVIFTMINICRRSSNPRVRKRWMDVKHVFNTDIPIDYEKLGKDALMRIRAGEPPLDVVLSEMERFSREQEAAS